MFSPNFQTLIHLLLLRPPCVKIQHPFCLLESKSFLTPAVHLSQQLLDQLHEVRQNKTRTHCRKIVGGTDNSLVIYTHTHTIYANSTLKMPLEGCTAALLKRVATSSHSQMVLRGPQCLCCVCSPAFRAHNSVYDWVPSSLCR